MGIYRPKGSKNYHIKKVVKYGDRKIEVRGSTGTSDKRLAEKMMMQRVNEETEKLIYGVRNPFTFEDGACELLASCGPKRKRDLVSLLDGLMPFLANVVLSDLHNQHPQVIAFKSSMEGRKNNTINRYLEILRTMLNKAATLWVHESKTWIAQAPRVVLLPRSDQADGYPLSRGQQRVLFSLLSEHYLTISTVAVHCGARKGELLNLRWDYEQTVNGVSLFSLPTSKNGQARLLFLNSEARSAIDRCRGKHPEYVFTYLGEPLRNIGKGWNNARLKAGLDEARGPGQHFRFHDLRHTCATRLRECNVNKEDRADILGHKNADITTHYSSGEVMHLIDCVERIVRTDERPTLYVAATTQKVEIPSKHYN